MIRLRGSQPKRTFLWELGGSRMAEEEERTRRHETGESQKGVGGCFLNSPTKEVEFKPSSA